MEGYVRTILFGGKWKIWMSDDWNIAAFGPSTLEEDFG